MSEVDKAAFEAYVADLFGAEDDALRAIQASARANELPNISVQPVDGYLLHWLARLVNARKIVEIGTLAGYSGTWLARALPDDGRLFTLEVSSKHAEVAQANFAQAGVAEKVEVVQGAAADVLKNIEPHAPFDMVFIDADKGSYGTYLEWAAAHLRPGGIMAAHNAFRGGGALHPENDDDRAVDAFNRALATDPRWHGMILPLGDGMAVAMRR